MDLFNRPHWAHLPRRPDEAKSWGTMILVTVALALLCLGIGYFSGILGTVMLEKPMVLVGTPAMIALFFLFLIDRPKLLMAILLLRAALDPILEAARISVGSINTGIGGLLNALIIALTISAVLESKNKGFKQGAAIFAPFMLITFLGIFRSPLPGDAIKLYLSLLTYFCSFLVGIHLASSPGGHRLPLRVVVLSSLIPVGISLIMLATGWSFGVAAEMDDIPGAEGGRFAGPFTHPNIMAFYLLLNVALVLYLWRTSEVKNFVTKFAAPTYLALLVVLLLLTKTRSAWGACFLLFFLYGSFIERRFLLVLVLGMLLSTLLPSVRERLVDLTEGNAYVQYAKLNSYAWRVLIWTEGLSYMEPVKYLFGYGFEAFKFFSLTFFSMAGSRMWGAHSVYVEVFFELGLVGLLAFAWLLLALVWQMGAKALKRDLLAALGVLLVFCYALICYSDNIFGYLVFNVYFWLAMGGIFGKAAETKSSGGAESAT